MYNRWEAKAISKDGTLGVLSKSWVGLSLAVETVLKMSDVRKRFSGYFFLSLLSAGKH